MHPWIHSDQPEIKCSLCGMDLVATSRGSNQEAPPGIVPLSASTVSVLGVKTMTASQRPLERTLRFAGTVEEDTSRRRILSAFVGAWVERTHVSSVGESVRAGQPLLSLYSQGILSAEWELINAFRAGEPPARSAELAIGRLRAIGLNDEQIELLKARSEPEQMTTLFSPIDGTLTLKNVYPGQNVAAGETLLEIADFSVMWFVFEAYQQDLPWLSVGQRVDLKLSAVPGKTLAGTISLIDPTFNESTRTTRVRVELKNPLIGDGDDAVREIPHRVIGEGVVHLAAPTVLTLPRTAVLDAGRGPVAYVDLGDNTYGQRQLKLGRVGDVFVEVVEGVEEGEAVVVQGNLLIDAQAQLSREALGPVEEKPSSVSPRSSVVDVRLHEDSVAGQPPTDRKSVARERLLLLVDAASAGADALASDDFSRYQEVFPQLQTAGEGLSLPPLVKGEDISAARRSFEGWSTAAADLIRPEKESLGAKIYQCPMAPVLKKGRWIQKDENLKNPFFGSKMLRCGVELK